MQPLRAVPTVMRRLGVAITTAMAVCVTSASAAETELWTAPVTLASCRDPGAPLVLFPSDNPSHATGPGAIAWSVSKAGCGGGPGLRIATLGASDIPGNAHPLPGAQGAREPSPATLTAAATAPRGRIVLVGAEGDTAFAGGRGSFTEGLADGPFAPASPIGGPAAPVAAVTAYLGDVAIASLVGAGEQTGLQMRMQRHYQAGFAAPVWLSRGVGPVSEIALALDFRSDALAAWRRQGSIYARTLSERGGPGPVQRLGPVDPDSDIVALNSDDDRGTVAWSTRRGERTSVYADVSSPGVRFGSPQLLERFRDLGGPLAPAHSVRLVRLARESVLVAWTGMQAGRYVVRVASVSHSGVRRPKTISIAGADALLRALVPGPANEVLALWSAVERNGVPIGRSSQSIFATRALDSGGVPSLDAPERVSAPGPSSGASVAFDPGTDNAIATWREGGSIRFAVRAASPAALSSLRAEVPGASDRAQAGQGLETVLSALLVLFALSGAVMVGLRRKPG